MSMFVIDKIVGAKLQHLSPERKIDIALLASMIDVHCSEIESCGAARAWPRNLDSGKRF